MALMARAVLLKNNIHIPFNNAEVSDAMLESSQILIQGQIDVLTDIGSLGILNRKMGAASIKNEVLFRRHFQGVGQDAGAAMRRRTQAHNLRPDVDGVVIAVVRDMVQGNMDRHGRLLSAENDTDQPVQQELCQALAGALLACRAGGCTISGQMLFCRAVPLQAG